MFNNVLKSIQEKVSFPDENLETLKPFFIPKKLRKRQYVLNAGDVCQHISFVEKWLLRSFTVDDDGNEHVVQFATEGSWISDMGSFISENEALYNIEALEDCELLNLTKHAMDELLTTIPVMERFFRILMQNNIVSLQRRVIAYMSLSCPALQLKLTAEHFTVDEFHRFEGMSSTDDNSIVFAITSDKGVKGILIDAYGVYASNLNEAMIRKLSITR